MKAARILGSILVLIAAVARPAAAADAAANADVLFLGAGLVDQRAIGEAPSFAIGVEHDVSPIFAAGGMAGAFSKDERCCESRYETIYFLGILKARIPRDGVRPFAQVGLGFYFVESVLGDDNQPGWTGGIGLETPERRKFSLSIVARYHSVTRPDFGPLADFKEIQLALRRRL